MGFKLLTALTFLKNVPLIICFTKNVNLETADLIFNYLFRLNVFLINILLIKLFFNRMDVFSERLLSQNDALYFLHYVLLQYDSTSTFVKIFQIVPLSCSDYYHKQLQKYKGSFSFFVAFVEILQNNNWHIRNIIMHIAIDVFIKP